MSAVLESLDQVVPLGTVVLIVWIAIMSRDIKHLANNIDKLDKRIEENRKKLDWVITKNFGPLEGELIYRSKK